MNKLTLEEHHAAEAEGWCICTDCDSADGDTQLQRIDENAILPNDKAAWQLVARRAAEGSALHQKALRFIASRNPAEIERIRQAAM